VLQLSSKDFEAVIIKIFQQEIAKSLESGEKQKISQRK
jgi:hypothetical protein